MICRNLCDTLILVFTSEKEGEEMDASILSQIASAKPTIRFCNLFNGLSPLWDYSLHRHPYMELIYRKKALEKQLC